MRGKTLWTILFITVIGAALRLACIDKPDGLWNDEYVSWSIASIPLGKNFIDAVFAQCHMPFYYLYLKFFIHFLGNSDLMLRLTSVIPGVLSIISMYFVGKEFKDEKLGILCASVTALSSFLIYFSQEVRFYELLFLFSSLALLFTLKLIKIPDIKNIIFYIIFSLLIIFTHTLGFVFVFFNLIFISSQLIRKQKKRHAELAAKSVERNSKPDFMPLPGVSASYPFAKYTIILWTSLFIISLLGLPLLVKIFTSHQHSQWWGHFTFSKIGFLITDYFSPVLTNIVSAPDNFFQDFTLGFLVFGIIPSLISIAGIVSSVGRAYLPDNTEYPSPEFQALVPRAEILPSPARGEEGNYSSIQPFNFSAFSNFSPLTSHFSLFMVSLAFIIVLILMAISGKMVFVTKYSMEIYPTLILLMSFGLLQFKTSLRYVLIFLFCFLNLFYIFISPVGAPKIRRNQGHKIVADLLKNADLKKGDFILLNYYPKSRFEKYFDFGNYNVASIDKNTFWQYLGINSEKEFQKADKNYFNKKFKTEILDKLKPDQKLAIVVLNDVSMYSPIQMQILAKENYKNAPFLFLVFSQVKNQALEQCLKNLQILRIEQKGSWSVVTFHFVLLKNLSTKPG
ncbi:MAG: glycosyltransferase family 39 protein [Candidatus Gastranaerophilales bacterium]|nr:glycosyltransferase family 39 protein [Candidatus Gastranaerophilales bacterium]